MDGLIIVSVGPGQEAIYFLGCPCRFIWVHFCARRGVSNLFISDNAANCLGSFSQRNPLMGFRPSFCPLVGRVLGATGRDCRAIHEEHNGNSSRSFYGLQTILVELVVEDRVGQVWIWWWGLDSSSTMVTLSQVSYFYFCLWHCHRSTARWCSYSRSQFSLGKVARLPVCRDSKVRAVELLMLK